MANKKIPDNSVDVHLANLNIRYRGLGRYESPDVLIEANNPDTEYPWRLTFKQTGRLVLCVSLADCLKQIRKAIAPNLTEIPPPKLSMTAPRGNAKPETVRKPKKDDPDQYGLGLGLGDM